MFEYFEGNYAWSIAASMAMDATGAVGEVDEACRPLKHLARADNDDAQEAWVQSWTRLAQRIEALGRADLAAGHRLSAGNKLRRAALYFIMAERMGRGPEPRRLRQYRHLTAVLQESAALRGEALERVEVPYAGSTLPGFLVRPPGPGPHKVMVHFNGFDFHKEILWYTGIAQALAARGVACLLLDHPGVGEALRLQGLPTIAEAEKPAAAALDWLATQPGLDARRAGIIALSLGGYHAARAAAFEPRFAACVCWGAVADYGAMVRARLAGRRPTAYGIATTHWEAHARWYFGTADLDATLALADQFNTLPFAHRIACPLLVIHGENDRQFFYEHAERFCAAATSAKVTLRPMSLLQGGAEHVSADNFAMAVDPIADWCAEVL